MTCSNPAGEEVASPKHLLLGTVQKYERLGFGLQLLLATTALLHPHVSVYDGFSLLAFHSTLRSP